jgi:hypothetical protein
MEERLLLLNCHFSLIWIVEIFVGETTGNSATTNKKSAEREGKERKGRSCFAWGTKQIPLSPLFAF